MDTTTKPQSTGMTCDHCSKEDCKQCVSDGGKNFCCQTCCNDYKAQDKPEKQKAEVNVCKFC